MKDVQRLAVDIVESHRRGGDSAVLIFNQSAVANLPSSRSVMPPIMNCSSGSVV